MKEKALALRKYKACLVIVNKKGGFKMGKEKTVGEGVGFERIRRITGYLVGTVERFNNGKRAEEKDRVKHTM